MGTEYTRRAGYDVGGRDGHKLSEHWADGYRSMHGMLVNGFPNLIVMGTTQAGFTANYPHLLDEQAKQIGYLITEAEKRQAKVFEVTETAEEAWVDEIIDKAMMREKFLEECTPGYYNNEGAGIPDLRPDKEPHDGF